MRIDDYSTLGTVPAGFNIQAFYGLHPSQINQALPSFGMTAGELFQQAGYNPAAAEKWMMFEQNVFGEWNSAIWSPPVVYPFDPSQFTGQLWEAIQANMAYRARLTGLGTYDQFAQMGWTPDQADQFMAWGPKALFPDDNKFSTWLDAPNFRWSMFNAASPATVNALIAGYNLSRDKVAEHFGMTEDELIRWLTVSTNRLNTANSIVPPPPESLTPFDYSMLTGLHPSQIRAWLITYGPRYGLNEYNIFEGLGFDDRQIGEWMNNEANVFQSVEQTGNELYAIKLQKIRDAQMIQQYTNTIGTPTTQPVAIVETYTPPVYTPLTPTVIEDLVATYTTTSETHVLYKVFADGTKWYRNGNGTIFYEDGTPVPADILNPRPLGPTEHTGGPAIPADIILGPMSNVVPITPSTVVTPYVDPAAPKTPIDWKVVIPALLTAWSLLK